jgi:predicted AAA+ superfamily ATPase
MFIIEREFSELLQDYPVVCLVGPRQVGKTSFIKAFCKSLPDQSLYLDLELSSDMSKLSDPQFYLEQHSDKTIIIDEVQHRRDLFPLLRTMIDADRRPGRFILLGSASRIIIQDTSESLAGRIAFLELKSFSLSELPDIFSWKQLWLQGGLPLSLLARNQASSMNWRSNFIRSYVERDLPFLWRISCFGTSVAEGNYLLFIPATPYQPSAPPAVLLLQNTSLWDMH